ncbi:MAG TPA: hypothetical protein VF516_03975 [Kofleriaceae bacterium]
MNLPIEVDLLSRISVPLFVHEAHRETWMTACLIGPDVALTSASLGAYGNQPFEIQVEGKSHTGRLEIFDDDVGIALVRFDPAVQSDLPQIFSTREQTVLPGAGSLTLANLGHDRSISLSGTVLRSTTRNGKPFYVVGQSQTINDVGGISGAPVIIEGRVLGLISGVVLPGRSGGLSTFLVAPFSALRGTPLAERLAALGLADHAADPESPPSPVLTPADPEDARLFAMLSPRARLALSHADAMRRAMQLESVHIEQLVAALQQQSSNLAADALAAAGLDEQGLRDLVAQITGAALPEAVQSATLSTLPPLSVHARDAVVAASRLSSDGIIHLRDLLAGAMSVTGSSFIRALIELGVRVPPVRAPTAADANAAPRAAPDPAGTTAPAPAATISTLATALAGFRSDGVSDQDDLLDIERDVAALCSVIAARDVEPPRSARRCAGERAATSPRDRGVGAGVHEAVPRADRDAARGQAVREHLPAAQGTRPRRTGRRVPRGRVRR